MKINYRTFLGTLVLLMPVGGYAEPVQPAATPLFVSTAVKHNLILGIDDSGSMDFETLFPANDGALWLNDDGQFTNLDGTYVDSGDKYTSLFPNGDGGTDYTNAGTINPSTHYAIPPIKAYAFTRSSAYNSAYYDPAETYSPWPSYGGQTFAQYSGAAAPFDPFFTSNTLDLTASLDTSDKGSEWDFDIEDSDMVCDDSGNTCTAGDKDYTYYPATYWVIDSTSTYTFNPAFADGIDFYVDDSVLLEAEDATIVGDYQLASVDSNVRFSGLVDTAGNNDYIASPTVGDADTVTDPSVAQASFTFNVPEDGEYRIWIRKQASDGNSDSLWVNLYSYGSSEIALASTNNEFVATADGQEWIKWWQDLTHSSGWTWDMVGTVSLDAATSKTLRIRIRESFVPVDQVLITKVNSVSPSGAMTLQARPSYANRNCGLDSDINPAYYNAFRTSPGAFSGVEALGPDGRCLTKVEIRAGVASYPSGRTYDEELQNFSNWFTYYRRRHQAMRGGLGAAFQGIGGIQAGMFWINLQREVSMYDLDDTADLATFLSDHYTHVNSGGTPLRAALSHARSQYRRPDGDAPISYECQKNFTLLFTDGFAENETISGIGNEDGTAGTPYQDSYSSTMADIAYKMYQENPRDDLMPYGKVRVPSVCSQASPPASADCNANLHVNSYAVGLGAKGTIFDVSHDTVQDAYDNPPTWPDVSNVRDMRQIDDLYHAAVNGRGEIFNARTPAKLKEELSGALRDIIASLGSASGVTFNSATLESDSLIFSALFNSTAWSGDVEARALDPATGDIASNASWRAAAILDQTLPASRTIITYSNTANDGVAFRWEDGNDPLDSGQKEDLNTAPYSGNTRVADTLGQDRLDFLRGDVSEEGRLFRNRDGLLGDIVNSTPLYVGAPRLNWPDSDPFGDDAHPYSAFRGADANVSRTPMIYVGSNDGMLHGFKAVESAADGGGQELLSYIPRSLFSTASNAGLHYLTDLGYQHRNYVDLSPQAVDVYMPGSAGGTAAWRTVLLGGVRGGGTGLFALDITDPSTFSEANAADIALWEFDESDAQELNYQLEQPVVVMMNNDRWAMVFGNGFNNGDGSNPDDDKTGLFIVYMDGGLDGVWTRGTDFLFLDVGSTGGLGAVNAIDVNGDRVADRIYGGDLEGNLWAFDVSSSNASQWESAFESGNGAGAVPVPLFTASVTEQVDTDGDGTLDGTVTVPQPIAMRPLVLKNTLSPVGEEGPSGEDYLVYFGTGKYFEEGDQSDTSLQSMYGIWDRGDSQITRDALLQEQQITTTGNFRDITNNSIDWGGDVAREYGWYMDLPESGERVLNTPKFRGEVLFFETYTPNSDPCALGGSSWFMSVSMDGTEPNSPVFDSNNDGQINGDDGIYGGQRIDDSSTGATGILGDSQYYQDESGNPTKRDVEYGDDTNRAGRLGWHELTDF